MCGAGIKPMLATCKARVSTYCTASLAPALGSFNCPSLHSADIPARHLWPATSKIKDREKGWQESKTFQRDEESGHAAGPLTSVSYNSTYQSSKLFL